MHHKLLLLFLLGGFLFSGVYYLSTIIKNVRVSYSDMGRTYEGGGLRLFAIDRLADIDLDKLRGKDIFIEEDSVISQLNTEE